jgi:hypothetical protein
LFEKTAAINRFRPHGPAQLNSDAHDMGPQRRVVFFNARLFIPNEYTQLAVTVP